MIGSALYSRRRNPLFQTYEYEWITCRDGLPDKDGYYLVTMRKYGVLSMYIAQFQGGRWYWHRGYRMKGVLAWANGIVMYDPDEDEYEYDE